MKMSNCKGQLPVQAKLTVSGKGYTGKAGKNLPVRNNESSPAPSNYSFTPRSLFFQTFLIAPSKKLERILNNIV